MRQFVFGAMLILGVMIGACKKEDVFDDKTQMKVTLTIDTITDIDYERAVVKGKITIVADHHYISQYGVQYSETTDFNTDGLIHYYSNDSKETIAIIDTIDNIKPNTTYYIRLSAVVNPTDVVGGNFYSDYEIINTQKYPLSVNELSSYSGVYRDVITIKGRGFENDTVLNQVFFNGKKAVITSVSQDSLQVFVPKSAGTGDVIVKVGEEVANAGQFDYITTPYVVYTIAGGYDAAYAEGKGKDAMFNNPVGIAVDQYGNLFIADKNNYRIRKIVPDGTVSTFCGSGTSGYLNGSKASAKFVDPEQILLLSNGNILVSEFDGHCIRIISSDGNDIKTFSGDTTGGYMDGFGSAARFSTPAGMAELKDTGVFVGDMRNNRVRKINLGEVTTFAGDGSQGVMGGQGTEAQMYNSYAIAFDSHNNCFVSGGENGEVIFKITPEGLVSVFARDNGIVFANGICIDPQDNLFVAGANRIIKITPGGIISKFAGTLSSSEFSLTDGAISEAKFYLIKGITMDDSGNFYVTDKNSIRKIEKAD